MTRIADGSRQWLGLAALTLAGSLALPSGAMAGKADDTLRIAWGGGVGPLETADVYFTTSRTGIWFTHQVWDTLVYRNPDTMQYEPLLATSWKQVDDKTYEFKLREGVKFHNGEAFNADDVVYTFNWAIKPESNVLRKRELAWIAKVEKVDDLTVRIVANKVFPVALDYLAALPIYPNEYYASAGRDGMAAKPVGTGPYRVVEVKPAQEYRLEAYKDYVGGGSKTKPQISKVIIREIQDPQTQVAELISGGIDFSADLSTDQVTQMRRLPRLAVTTGETMRISYLGLDSTGRSGDTALKDPKVRQAINLAFNRAAYTKARFGDEARVIHTSCYPTQFGCDDSKAMRYAFDPEKAKALLAEAGHANGMTINLHTVPGVWVDPLVADLGKIGIKLNVNFMPWGSLSPKINNGEISMLADSHGSFSVNDASASVGYFFAGGPNDYARDAEVTKWVTEAEATANPDTRKELYRKAIERITAQAYHVPMSTHVRHYVHAKELDMKSYPDEIIRIFNYRWK